VALAACASNGGPTVQQSHDIGPPPAYLQPVPEPKSYETQSPVVDARAVRGALRQANKIIGCAHQDWRQTRDRMMGVPAGAHEKKGSGCAQPFPTPIK